MREGKRRIEGDRLDEMGLGVHNMKLIYCRGAKQVFLIRIHARRAERSELRVGWRWHSEHTAGQGREGGQQGVLVGRLLLN